ncbi:MAG: 16S rRNA (cytosine(1402)-N(4))-methyltransferase RsmH [bacterium]
MHISVLKDEAVSGLGIKSGDVILDGTLGGGGHTAEMVKRFGKSVKIVALDLDSDAISRAKSTLGDNPHDVVFKTAGFQDLDKVLDGLKISSVDKILLDLGLSSFQLDISGRGFSFMKDELLLMTMKKDPKDEDLTAREIVNTWDESTLRDILYGFGEEKHAKLIAHAIASARADKSIETTFDLVAIIDRAVGKYYRKMKIHPATRTFQALRIATNSELSNLEHAISTGWKRLSHGGRIAIISFHSLEDRIVKQAFVKIKETDNAKIITKKPIIPSIEETKDNPRSRSAKLRLIEKL